MQLHVPENRIFSEFLFRKAQICCVITHITHLSKYKATLHIRGHPFTIFSFQQNTYIHLSHVFILLSLCTSNILESNKRKTTYYSIKVIHNDQDFYHKKRILFMIILPHDTIFYAIHTM